MSVVESWAPRGLTHGETSSVDQGTIIDQNIPEIPVDARTRASGGNRVLTSQAKSLSRASGQRIKPRPGIARSESFHGAPTGSAGDRKSGAKRKARKGKKGMDKCAIDEDDRLVGRDGLGRGGVRQAHGSSPRWLRGAERPAPR